MVGRLLSLKAEKNEDKQTASVFSTLLHLPDAYFWKIIRDSCYNNNLDEMVGAIEFYEFWPHWSPDKKHKNYVEPDLFIRFEKVDVIIEAKRYDEYQQYQDQWESEYSAYKNEYGRDKRKVVLIAVGGVNPLNLSPENIFVQKCRWRGLLDTLYIFLDNFEEKNSYTRILENCIEYLEYFGFRKLKWLNDVQGVVLNVYQYSDILGWLKSGNNGIVNFQSKNLSIQPNSIDFCLQWRI